MAWYLLLGALALFGIACIPRKGLTIRTDFETDEPYIAELIKNSAKEWADAGVLVASIVTVNESIPGAMSIKRTPRDNMWIACNAKQGPAYRGDGCAAIENGSWDAIYLPTDLVDEERLRVVIMHELAHIFAGTKTHLADDQIGIMHPNVTSLTITPADIEFMRQYTEVVTPDDIADA